MPILMVTYIQKTVACGYLLITLFIAYIGHDEWQEVEALESENRQFDELRKEINDVARNAELNRHLQGPIVQIDGKVQANL